MSAELRHLRRRPYARLAAVGAVDGRRVEVERAQRPLAAAARSPAPKSVAPVHSPIRRTHGDYKVEVVTEKRDAELGDRSWCGGEAAAVV